MKKIGIAILVVLMAVMLVACGGGDKTIDVDALSSELLASDIFSIELVEVNESYIKTTLYLTLDDVVTYHVYTQPGLTGEEYGVFECTSKEAAATLKIEIDEHIQNFITQYEGYAPDIVPRLKNAVIKQSGKYVVFVAAENNGEALKIVEKYFN